MRYRYPTSVHDKLYMYNGVYCAELQSNFVKPVSKISKIMETLIKE